MLLLFNFFYRPSEAASAALLTDLAKGLSPATPLEVVTGVEGEDPPEARWQVTRYPLPLRLTSERFGKLAAYLYYLLRTTLRFLLRQPPPGTRCVFFTDPPFLEIVGGWLCRLRGIPYAVVILECFPDFATNVGYLRESPLTRWLRRAQIGVLRRAERVFYGCEDFRVRLREHGAPEGSLLEPWSDPAKYPRVAVSEWRTRFPAAAVDKTVIKYAGLMGYAFDAEGFFAALALLDERERERFQFVFQACGFKLARFRARAAGYSCIVFTAWQRESEFAPSLLQCDAHLILTPDSLYGSVYASKLFTAMAAGRPVVASIPRRSAMGGFIQENGIGISAPADDPAPLAAAWRALAEQRERDPKALDRQGAAGLRYTQSVWNREIAVKAFRKTLLGAG